MKCRTGWHAVAIMVWVFVAFLACCLARADAPEHADLYVSTDGQDTNPGTAEAPLATVAAARDAVRKRVATGLDRDVVVSIRAGTYTQREALCFGAPDSGTTEHSITYAAAPGEKVILSGGRAITDWKQGAGGMWTANIPEVKAGAWYFRQLFVNGRRAVRARTPNAGEWWNLQPGPTDGNQYANDATITAGVDHPIAAWNNISDVEVVWLYNNDGSRKRLGSVSTADNTFTMPPPHMWLHGLDANYNIGYPSPKHVCYFENAIEMLDQPGEWYLDRQTGVLSYWPREGEDMTVAEVVAPAVQNTLLAIQGTPEQPVRNLHFKGIHVAYVDWPLPAYGFTSLFGCMQISELEGPEGPKKFYWIDAAVDFKYARHCNFTGGGIGHVGAIGLSLANGCAENVVEGNAIHDLGGGGITAGAVHNRDTWKWADPLAKDDHKAYRIANNHIYDCGTDYFGAVGITAVLTQEAVIAHNLIHDISYAGIVLSGNESPEPPFAKNNTVEYNHIHDVMKTAVDGAGIYVSFPHAEAGAIIRGNVIHDLRRNPANRRDAGAWSAPGIYLDGVRPELGCSNYRFEGNLVYHTETPLFLNACDRDSNVWIDNVFLAGDAPEKGILDSFESKAGLEPAYRGALLKTGAPPNPKLVKLPVSFPEGMENTPVIFKDRPLLVQNYRPPKAYEQESGSYLFIQDLVTGQEVARLGKGFSFVSAFVDGEEMNLFAVLNTNNEWTKDIYRFWSSDLKSWNQEKVIDRKGDEHLFNTSVCRDDQGYLMAYDSNEPVMWSFRFARSRDLAHWENVPDLEFTDLEGKMAHGNATMRYFAPYYYAIYGVWSYQGGPWKHYQYKLPETMYVTVVARSKDLISWELSPTRSPMLEPEPGEMINNTDADLFEYEGRTYIYYATGNQQDKGTIRVAMYDGPMREMLEAYFPKGTPIVIRFDTMQKKYIYP